MKKLIALLLFVIITHSASSQWYFDRYGVLSVDSLNREQLNDALTRFSNLAVTGVVLTAFGILGIVGGILISQNGFNTIWGTTLDGFRSILSGISLASVGTLIAVPGFIIIAATGPREKAVKIALTKFQGSACVTAGVRIMF